MNVFDFEVTTIEGKSLSLREYAGKVLLIVNVASQCGFTGQYAGLETLYRQFHPRGFEVLGFPCNQFGKQEPGSEAEIQTFCSSKFSVRFPLFAKIEVNGPHADPLFVYLKDKKRGLLGRRIVWNFTKFLVNRSGMPVARYAPLTQPEKIAPDIERLLASPR